MRSPHAIPRTTLQRATARLGMVMSACATSGLALVELGKALSDRFHWSQYLAWIPTLPACALAAAALFTSWLLTRPRSRGRWMRRAGWGLMILGLVYSTQVEWAGGHAPPGPPREQRLRVIFWNFCESGDPGWESPAISEDPDLVIVRAGSCTQPSGLQEKMGDASWFCWEEGFMVASRLPIKGWGSGVLSVEQGMGIDPRESSLIRKGRDPGRAMWLTLDAHERLGRDVTLWLVDMPSDLSLSRVKAMQEATTALESGPTSWWTDDHARGWVKAPSDSPPPFRNPDVIMGDFNTPRGSYSLRTISRGFPSAYEQAGLGYAATFPRSLAMWQLDQVFVGPSLRACAHNVIDAGRGTHRMVVVDLRTPEIAEP